MSAPKECKPKRTTVPREQNGKQCESDGLIIKGHRGNYIIEVDVIRNKMLTQFANILHASPEDVLRIGWIIALAKGADESDWLRYLWSFIKENIYPSDFVFSKFNDGRFDWIKEGLAPVEVPEGGHYLEWDDSKTKSADWWRKAGALK